MVSFLMAWVAQPDEYTYVMGLPAWFFYSCILGYVVLAHAVIVVQVFSMIFLLMTMKVPQEVQDHDTTTVILPAI